jgi:hypothetical protein
MKHGLRKIRWRDGCLSSRDLAAAIIGCGLCLNLRVAAPDQDEQTPLGSGKLNDDSHELLNQPGEHNLA